MRRGGLRGVYAITPDWLCAQPLALESTVEKALLGGVGFIQYRDKTGDGRRAFDNAATVGALCRAHGARLIINDDVEMALRLNADGVHLGASDAPLATARQTLGADKLIGISCANSLARLHAADAGGADYLALGAFYRSHTKTDTQAADTALLRTARASTDTPICVIGGLTPGRAAPLITQGADLVAVSQALFSAADVQQRAQAFSRLFDAQENAGNALRSSRT